MVTHSHTLDWCSAVVRLVWQSPNTVKRPDSIYLKLWGLIQTINTTNQQYQQQLLQATPRSKPIIQAHQLAKQTHYPSDHFPLIAFHPTHASYKHIKLSQGHAIDITIAFGGAYAHKAKDWLNWFNQRLQLENTGFSIDAIAKLHYHSQTLPNIGTNTNPVANTTKATGIKNNQQSLIKPAALASQKGQAAQQQNNQQNNQQHSGQEISFFIDTPANLAPLNNSERQATANLSKVDKISYLLIAHSKKRLCDWFPQQRGYIEGWFATHQQTLFNSPICIYQLHDKHGIKSKSKSSPRQADGSQQIQHHKGSVGWLTLKGAWTQLGSFWQIMQSIHLYGQRKAINGLGHILAMDNAPQPPLNLWHRVVTQKSQILYAIHEVMERFSLDPELDEKGKIIQEQALCDGLYQQLSKGSYHLKPSHAFYVAKTKTSKKTNSRKLEQLQQADMVVHRLVFHAIADVLDAHQSPLSLGYRKGYSRQTARDNIQTLIHQGFSWVIEVDIEAFFDNVPFKPLWQQLASILPQQEWQTIELIKTLMTAPYDIKGKPKSKTGVNTAIERDKGLMQGSPLSPILANLYLAQLDHALQKMADNQPIAFVRYADDVLIFCREQGSANNITDLVAKQLQGLGLSLALDKTVMTQVKTGFEFLGYRFDKEGSDDKAIVPILRQRKPVVISGGITGSHKYLGVNGNALEVRERRPTNKGRGKNKTTNLQLLEIVPLRRISQLIVMGSHSLSSPLLSACAKQNISVHMVNRYGCQVGTMSPTNADFYAISAKQYQRHQALKPSDTHAIATDIVCAKVNNYQTWIKNSYRKGDAKIVKQLDKLIDKACNSTTTSELMGYEGQAAKICFARLQNCMIDEQRQAFSSRRRARGGVDRLNSMLNFGYYWLFTRISALLHSHGLNPYLSYLHDSEQSYETLVYDVMEMFRVQVDKTVLRLINRKQIQADSFVLDVAGKNYGSNAGNNQQPQKGKGWKLTNQALHLFINQLQATFASKINQTFIEDIVLIQVRTILQWVVEGKSLVWFYWYSDKDNPEFLLNVAEQQSIVIDTIAKPDDE